MAERRMFAKTIIDSDAFLDMPLSSQCLYFHLSMRADDEGFINNPRKIQRMIGCSDDDMKILLAKNFVIAFDTGVVVIKHWKIHNYIRSDRLTETKYQEERSLLTVKDNGAYTFNRLSSAKMIESVEETEIKSLEELDAKDKRKVAYQNSSLPYSFTYKIRRAFDGKVCPICGKVMNASYKTSCPTVQHNLPISKGGLHELENISVICESCNTSIRDKETDKLNNADVIETWDKIVTAEKNGIDWFTNVNVLDTVGQMSVKCPSNDSIGKDRLGKSKDRLNILYSLVLKDGSEYPITEDDLKGWEKNFPSLDVRNEFLKMQSWCESNPSKRKTKTGIKRFINGWLSKVRPLKVSDYEEVLPNWMTQQEEEELPEWMTPEMREEWQKMKTSKKQTTS